MERTSFTVDVGCLSSKHWTVAGSEVMVIGALLSLLELMKVATTNGNGFAWSVIEISKSGWASIPIAGLEDVRNQV